MAGVLVLGLLLTVWGIAILALARPLHTHWASMVRELRAAGFRKPPFGTAFVASERGLRVFLTVGGAGLIVGLGLIVAGLLSNRAP